MFLRDAHIKQPFGEFFFEFQQTGTPGHRSRNSTHPAVPSGQFPELVTEGLGEGSGTGRNRIARFRIKFANTVEPGRILLRWLVASALLGGHMDQHWRPQIPGRPQNRDQFRNIMTIHGTQVFKSHILKNGIGQQGPLDAVFDGTGHLINGLTTGDPPHRVTVPGFHALIALRRTKAGQMIGHTSHIAVNGHFIVVEDHDHGLTAFGSVIQTLIDHTAGGGTVTQQRDHMVILLLQGSCPGHTQSDGHRAGCVTGHKGIGITFAGFGKSGHAAKLPQTGKIRLATGQQLMDIRLMTNIKNQAVTAGIKYSFQGQGKLHNAQIGGQMASRLCNIVYQEFPDLTAELLPLRLCQADQVIMVMNAFENIHKASQPNFSFSSPETAGETGAANG